MRTTVDLPDDLVRAARVRAAESDETLKQLFTRALTRELSAAPARRRGSLPLIRTHRTATVRITPSELAEALEDDPVA